MDNVIKPIRIVVTVAATLLSASAGAGSFSLYTESSAAAVGNYAAGIAAEAGDAAIGWYNPAGLSLIQTEQWVVGGVGVFPVSKITGTSTFTTVVVPDYMQTFSNLNGANDALVPSLHYARPIGEHLTAGLSIIAPFGLSTNWNPWGPVRYAATYSQLVTSTISPELGGEITDNFAIGAGIDLQFSRVKFNQELGSPAYLQALSDIGIPVTAASLDSYSYNQGKSFAPGFHAGLLLMTDDHHGRLGLNYQSSVHHVFHGFSRLTGPLATPGLETLDPFSIIDASASAVSWSHGLYSNPIDFPEIVTLSGYRDINERLAVLGSVVYTGWHRLKTINLTNVAAYVPTLGQTTVNSIALENYRDTWRFALGFNYHVNEVFMLRAGTGYDQTPTVNAFRDIRIADSDRVAVSVGAHYQAKPCIGIDVGYTHLFSTGEVGINKTNDAGVGSTYTVNARAKGSADLVGLQLTWLVDKQQFEK